MAGLKCSHCGFGIHYHDEPCGIEYTLIPVSLWNKCLNEKRSICRIILDVPDSYLTIWKCPKCNSLHLFEGASVHVKDVYIPTCSVIADNQNGVRYILFDDFTFENVADGGITPKEYEFSAGFSEKLYAVINESGIIVFKDKQLKQPLRYYQKGKISSL